MNNNQITCPNCGTAIDIDEILNHQADEKYKKKYLEDANRLAIEKKEFEDKKRNENEIFQQKLNQQLQQKLQEEKIRIEQEQTKKATEKFEIELKRLAQEKQEQKEQIDVLKNTGQLIAIKEIENGKEISVTYNFATVPIIDKRRLLFKGNKYYNIGSMYMKEKPPS